MASIRKRYGWSDMTHLMILLLSSLDRCRYIRGWWSVSSTNSFPSRNTNLNFIDSPNQRQTLLLHHRIRLFSGRSLRLAYATGLLSPSSSWRSTAPIPTSEASVLSMNCCWKFGRHSIGLLIKQVFRILNAVFWSCSHTTWLGSRFFVRSERGAAIVEKFGMNFL